MLKCSLHVNLSIFINLAEAKVAPSLDLTGFELKPVSDETLNLKLTDYTENEVKILFLG